MSKGVIRIISKQPKIVIKQVGMRGQAGQSGDKTYVQDFTTVSSVTVNHNLEKYPAVTIIDTSGDAVESDVNYVSLQQLVVNFSAPFSGRITCN